jgi:hypothetical protein
VFGRKAAFWGAVAGVSILANFGVELLAAKLPSEGLRSLVGFIHRGPGGA